MADQPKKQSDSNRRYTMATARLREAHAEEFQAILAQVYQEEGAVYVPRLTPEERAKRDEDARRAKAAEKMASLLAEFPDLAPGDRSASAESAQGEAIAPLSA